MKHTPGPYFYEREEETRYCSSTGVKERSWIWHTVKSEKGPIASFLDTGFLPGGDEEQKANAHLLSAGPEMLAALIAMDEYTHREYTPGLMGNPGRDRYEREEIWAMVRAAIAKARGQK